MTEELVTITVDGQELKAPKGAMLISVTDDNGIRVPRFCYHKKLSVAANCRMCLVDVEKAPKPMPACATPVMDGMVVHTKSPRAIAAQKSVMEFLLINHPLDCPICDQGGECELQDVSMGYGGDVSQYSEIKRVVFDKDIGSLIQTELTRCIQCTRCIRFGEEIAGMRELGATDRGDRMVIGTFIEKSVDSEMSGNVIDICPVGALTAKPSRFAGRAWEMEQHPGVAPHDSVGSNINIHTLRGKVIRVVPRDNETINEVWISDRDRFSYQGLYADDRAMTPMIKNNGEWQACDWDEALQKAATGLQAVSATDVNQLGAWISPNATLEEHYLLQKIIRGLGSHNIDHRLHQTDFTDQVTAPVMPWLGQSIEDLEQLNAALLIGSYVRKQQPLMAHRLRKAAINHAANISFVNPRKFDWHFPVMAECVSSAAGMLEDLAAIAKVACESATAPAHLADVINAAQVNDQHKQIANSLKQADKATVLIGTIATQHPQLSVIRQLAGVIAEQTSSVLGYLPEANSAGAWLAGSVPHRGPAGQAVNAPGATVAEMKAKALKGLITFNVEPEFDMANGVKAIETAQNAECVVAISSYVSDKLKDYADVILPLAAFTETSGTYVNAEGFWQGFKGASIPQGQSRPGWKVLRVLGNLFNLDGFDYVSSQDVKDEIKQQCQTVELSNKVTAAQSVKIEKNKGQLQRVGDVPLYAIDALVRRAVALQKTNDAKQDCARMNSRQANQSGVADAEKVKVIQGAHSYMSLVIDESIPDGCVWISAAQENSLMLGDVFGPIELEKV